MSEVAVTEALAILRKNGKENTYEKICEMSLDDVNEYSRLLEELQRVNGNSSVTNDVKGKALENIVTFLLQKSGDIFHVDANLGTNTNELDQLIGLKNEGKTLCRHGLIDKRYSMFISECKNHQKSLDVTYIGKFCSLLITNNVKLGLLFSYHGVSGNKWENGAGLIKKFYLHKETLDERFCIIDFNINDFKSIIEQNKNLLQIIDEKITSLQFDTDYSRHLAKHPAEDY